MAIKKYFGCLKCGWNMSTASPDDFHTELHRDKQYGDEYLEMEFLCLNASCKHVNKLYWGKPKSM